ncbi:CynX/NimT family MFS transporter [Microbacterium sp. CFBP9034]|uniref:MFS transporter n=1 Tax=Microbacterium sp. CFBP9034 TaxID=3096540 RepID=UPI002A69FA51|nr:MFS transporter [Microbacterium sp. CFBP9034]MDY0909955.1 MFS transporter [Microbacterium sp. CFBP9034]
MTPDLAAHARRGLPWLVIAGVMVAALSLRGPIVATTPVLTQIEDDFGIGSATAGLLTTAPVLMFAVLTPVAALVIRRAGAELALLISLSGVLIGTLVRALPGFGWMLTGMVIIGASITIGNVVIPVIIRRDVAPDRVALVTAAYAATLNAGSLLTSLLTAPIAALIGWPAALLTWSLITVAGIVLWTVHLRRARRAGADAGDRYSGAQPVTARPTATGVDPAALTGPLPVVARDRSLLGRPVVWLLLAAFGLQCLIYYALSTWLPTFAADELGLDAAAAGAIASVYQGVGILGAFLVPLLLRFTPRIVTPLVICASWLTVTTGLVFAPELLWVWLAVGAIGHAGGFVVIFSALVAVARSDSEAAGMSALIQGGGYTIGALGAPLMGGLLEATGGWTAALVLMLVLAVVYCVALLAAVAASARATR